jgi:hypothetical protein
MRAVLDRTAVLSFARLVQFREIEVVAVMVPFFLVDLLRGPAPFAFMRRHRAVGDFNDRVA